MNPEILAKIMGIIAKTGDRVIVIDPKTGTPFALMNLDQYEKLVLPPKPPALAGFDPAPFQEYHNSTVGQDERRGAGSPPLTVPPASGMIDSVIPPWVKPARGEDDWGGNEEKEEDRYYMEPTE
mgnify:FL=1